MFLLATLLLAPPASAHGGHPQMVLQDWDGPLVTPQVGTRFAAIVEAVDEEPVLIEVFDGNSWREAKEVFRIRNRALVQTDLYEEVNSILMRSPDEDRITFMEWDLLIPTNEPQGPPRPPMAGVLPPEIEALGVISREDWGARPSTCVMSEEDDWYRMAIHHTAGNQDTGGSVKEQVQWLQVFFQESRGYCDIAYQFLVGRDGSIWEGRPYDYYSAATGGNQNNGNMAISFMGCYDSQVCGGSSYPGPHVPSETMIDNVHDLIYTISQVEDIPTDSDHIKGHNDWPGNNTACPGDTIEERIPDWFVPPGPDYAASLVESGFPLADEAAIVLKIGETIEGYLEFENTGRSDWTAMTRVATLPRNEASPVYGDEWIEPHRAVAGDTNAAPGETARFSFSLKGREAGVYYQDFTLVQEGIKWFEDDGGVTPEEITLRIVVDDEEVVTDSGSLNDSSDPDYTRTPVSELGACACTSTPRRDALFPGLLALLGSILIRRRR